MRQDQLPSSSPPDEVTDPHKWFMWLFLENERLIFRYVGSMVPSVEDVQDIVQETARALWAKFDEYDRDRPFAPWAFRFVRIEVRRWLQSRDRWRRLLANGLAEELAARQQEAREGTDAQLRHLRTCLNGLPDAQRRLVTGYYYRREAIDDLARIGGRTTAAVYKALQRIRQALSKCIRLQAAMKGGPR